MSSDVISSLSTITPTTVTSSRSAGAGWSVVGLPSSSVSMMPTSNDEPTLTPAASAKRWLTITSCGLSGSSTLPEVVASRSMSR